MDNDITTKLHALKMAYINSLPEKFKSIMELWQKLQHQWDDTEIENLHRQIHSLHGSSGVYELGKICEQSKQLEHIISDLKQPPTEAIIELVDQSLTNLNRLIADINIRDNINLVHDFEKIQGNKNILILIDDPQTNALLTNQLQHFQFKVEACADNISFTDLIKRFLPHVIIIDIKFLDDFLSTQLNLLKNNINPSLQIIFISEFGNMELRLKAVRARGDAFLIKPILIEKVVAIIASERKIPYKILIIEDSEDVANYYQLVLQQASMQSLILTQPMNIEKVLIEYAPDLILLDINMPNCDGIELASILRQQETYGSIPIVFLSAEENRDKRLKAMQVGGDGFITKSTSVDYVIVFVKNRAERYRMIRTLIMTDSLTGVLNHTSIHHKLINTLKEASRLNFFVSLVMIDLDHFKNINDEYGHPIGDRVLQNLCLLLKDRLRDTDSIGRYGGEEFLLILPNTKAKEAQEVVNTLRNKFSLISFTSENQKKFNVTFSAGIAVFPNHTGIEDLINAADKALYLAKENGRNMVVIAA